MMTGSGIARLTQPLGPIITLVLWVYIESDYMTYVRDLEN